MTEKKQIVSKGLEGVIAAESAISWVRGSEGQLIYRGYSINQLVENCCYEEVIFLLHRGHLPNQAEFDEFVTMLRKFREVPKEILDFFRSTPRDAKPMDVIRTAVSMHGLYDVEGEDHQDRSANQRRAMNLVATMPLLVAHYHRIRQGLEPITPRADLSEAAHFLYLLDGEIPSAEAEKTLDVAFTLHADHDMNASTFSARVTIATLSDFYSAVTSAIGTLKGPLHGGANEGVIHMLQEIGNLENVDAYVEKKLANKEKIMGIGHRVYRTLDPRAPHLRKMAVQLTEKLGEPKWIKMSERIAELMKEKKGLNANVDFYSATVYYSLGVPTDLFTPIFAIARTTGWTAQLLEQLEDNRLYRPLISYVGQMDLPDPLPMADRG